MQGRQAVAANTKLVTGRAKAFPGDARGGVAGSPPALHIERPPAQCISAPRTHTSHCRGLGHNLATAAFLVQHHNDGLVRSASRQASWPIPHAHSIARVDACRSQSHVITSEPAQFFQHQNVSDVLWSASLRRRNQIRERHSWYRYSANDRISRPVRIRQRADARDASMRNSHGSVGR